MDGRYKIKKWVVEFNESNTSESDKHIDDFVPNTNFSSWIHTTEKLYEFTRLTIEQFGYRIGSGYAYSLSPVKQILSPIEDINESLLENAPNPPYLFLYKGAVTDVIFADSIHLDALSQSLNKNVYYHEYYDDGLYWRTLFVISK